MEYTILIHKAEEGGFWAEVPALPGCFSQGETVEETIANTKERGYRTSYLLLKGRWRRDPGR